MLGSWGWIVILWEVLQLAAPASIADKPAPAAQAAVAPATEAAAKPAVKAPNRGEPGLTDLAVNPVPAATITPLVAAPPAIPGGAPVTQPESNASDAERIARLQRTVDTDEGRLQELRQALNNPDSEYGRAEKAFKELDAALEATKRKLQEAQTAGRLDEVVELEDSLEMQTEPWRVAKNAFDLALEERRTKQASVATLEAKIQRDREAAEKLLSPTINSTTTAIPPVDATTPAAAALTNPATSAPTTPATAAATPTAPATVAPAPTGETPAAPAAPAPAAPASPIMSALAPASIEAAPPATAATSAPPKEPSKEVIAATNRAEVLNAAAAEAEKEAVGISERLELLKADIAQQRQLRQLALKKVDAANATTARLTNELEKSPERGENWDKIWMQLTQAQQEEAAARVESRKLADRLDELQSEMASLQTDELAAMSAVEVRRKDAEAAKLALDELKNPFSLKNIVLWLQTRGVVVGIITSLLFVLLRMGSFIEPRLTALFISTSPRGSREERENRATTLVSVLLNVVRTAAVVIGCMLIMEQFGIPVGPLLGGAAVIGLAVAFGAQSLIKDYFTGFMVLLEQQYMINDVVKIGEISGQVERITMRTTVLRDLEGKVHFVPHGQITTVTNMTHGWSRTLIDLGVSYNEDIDQVIEVLTAVGMELRADPRFGALILDNPELLGVEELGDSAVVIRMLAKTRPIRQWEVKREWLKRIKRRFDELGIEIPYPHQTVYLRSAGKEAINGFAHDRN